MSPNLSKYLFRKAKSSYVGMHMQTALKSHLVHLFFKGLGFGSHTLVHGLVSKATVKHVGCRSVHMAAQLATQCCPLAESSTNSGTIGHAQAGTFAFRQSVLLACKCLNILTDDSSECFFWVPYKRFGLGRFCRATSDSFIITSSH